MRRTQLRGPIFPADADPEWAGATWIGEIVVSGSSDAAVAPMAHEIPLTKAEGYSRARLLVRSPKRVYGMVTIPVRGGSVAGPELERLIGRTIAAPDPLVESPPIPNRHITVIVCTRDRPDALRTALASVLELDYPDFDVIVVDNAPTTDSTQGVVDEFADPRLRLVTEQTPGLSRARNTGLRAARGSWVAFTDDDVLVDRSWLTGLCVGITRGGDRCACVTGLVPTGEMRSPAQAWFDSRISWNRNLRPRLFRLDEPPADLPLFPFQVGSYGTGANFAARRDIVARLGGFDVHLGAGTPSKGGEDIDFFFKVIVRGYTLAYEPTAIVWHRHRDSETDLAAQAEGYGRGFAAWVTKTMLHPLDFVRGLIPLLRRRSFSTKPLAQYRRPLAPGESFPELSVDIIRHEHRATLAGPPAYLRSRSRALGARLRHRKSR